MLVMILKSLRLSILYQVELVYLHYHLILGYQWYIYSALHLKKITLAIINTAIHICFYPYNFLFLQCKYESHNSKQNR